MRSIASIFIGLTLLLSSVNLAHAANQAEWTVMVFENGKNNLDEYIQMDMNEMEMVGSSDKVNVVAEWGSYSKRKVVRTRITRDNDPQNITSPVLQDVTGADMGSWREVVAFVNWSKTNFPAKHYMLVVADHGAGWRASDGKIVSIDELTGNGIRLPQLSLMAFEIKKLLGKNIDIVGFDACLMAMTEVAAEFWGNADYLLASQEVEPGYGWSYRDMLPYFMQNPTASPLKLGQATIKAYMASYSGGSQGNEQVTMSLVNLSVMDTIAKDLRDFAETIYKKASSDQKLLVSKAFATAQHYYNSDYIDLVNFYELIRGQKSLSSVVSDQWIVAAEGRLKQAVVANGVTKDYSNSHGLSIWGPSQEYFQNYGKEYMMTRFDRGTKWSAMLGALYQNAKARNIRFAASPLWLR
ncbi:MAG: hypothetical protein JST80_06545 [Bdellovibrionales bacterium]|nr:hypothetical protein [Bdellovibrionales bacterium]